MKRGRPMLEETKIKNEWERLFHLLETTHAAAEKQPEDPVPYYDSASLMDAFFSLDEFEGQLKWRKVHDMNRKQQKWLVKAIKGRPEKMVDLIDLYGNSLRVEAPYVFDQYMLYMEFDRSPEEKFYLPRRKQLKPFVDAIQDLEDDRLDELFTSCPPRIGKTTLADFAVTWVAGKHPCESNLYSSCSDTVTKVFYNGLMELIKDTVTYKFDKVFPNSPLVKANADYQTINLLRNDRYPTITCRSIDGTLNGACDCSHFQIGDDLCKGIEQAMNKDVMMRLWQKVQNDFLTRGKQGVKRWWIGTRWSLIDPQGIRQDMLSNDPNFKDLRWKVINIPALNENEESNFNYKYGVGFDSKTYKRIRAGFERNDDLASWSAQYQGKPIEREGSLFSAGEMRFYNGVLPEGEPNRIFIALDPSWGGGDYCAGPVCVQYGDDIYIPDVVYTNEDKRKSLPMIGHVIRNNSVRSVQIEANKMTEGYADELRDELRKMNIMCTITTKPAPPNMRKEDRIRDRAPEIRGNMIFLESGIRTKTYQSFMDNVFSFTIIGKNKHDDAPDSLSMAADMVFKRGSVYAQVFKRFI